MARLFARFSDFLLLLVLARILAPEDFGLVTIATAITAILDVITDVPLAAALVRLDRIDKRYSDTAFTLGLLRAILMVAIVSALAYPAGLFYEDPRLTMILPVLALAPAVRAMQSPGMAMLFKAHNFRASFLMEVGGKFIGFAAAVTVALVTQNYWALVISPVVANVSNIVLSYLLAPCRVGLSLGKIRYFSGFLGWLFPAQFVSAVMWQFDRLFLGSVIPKATLGHYGVAYNLASLVEQSLRKATNAPLMSSFVLLGDQKERLCRGYRMTDSAIIMAGLPIYLPVILFAHPLVAVVLGPEWQPTAPLLQGLAIALLPAMARLPFRPLALAVGRTDYVFYVATLTLLVRVPFVMLGYGLGGVNGVITGIGCAGVINALITMHFVFRITGMRPLEQAHETWRPLLAAILPGLLGWYLNIQMQNLTGLALGASLAGAYLLFVALYGLCLWALWSLAGKPDSVEARLISRIRSLRARDK